jgi:hypothetical protein
MCLLAPALAVGAGVVHGQAPAPDAPRQEIVAEILRLDSIWLNASVTADAEAVRPILADDFVGQVSGTLFDKEGLLERVANSVGVIGVPAERVVVNVYGDIAVAHAVRRRIVRVGGDEVTSRFAYTDVYRYREGRWVAITGQSAALPGG